MEDQLRFFFVLPLKEIAMRRVVVNLWNEPDISASIEVFSSASREFHSFYSQTWRETVESKVTDKLSKLKLPMSLKKQVLDIITPIGLQIKKWKGFHEHYLEIPNWKVIIEKCLPDSRAKFDAAILSKLCWTTAGGVDYRKTAEELVRCEMVDILKRYQLASLYCLDDYIPIFWKDLPQEIKKKFYNGGTPLSTRPDMQFCWPYILNGELCILDRTVKYCNLFTSFHRHAVHYSASRGNKAATEHFFRKLTREEKEASLYESAVAAILHRFDLTANSFPLQNFSDVLCYLISQMNHEQRRKIFKEYLSKVLLSFIEWPYEDIFLKNAHLFWALLPATNYDNMLWRVSDYFRKSEGYFAKFFREFFIQSPVDLKKLFVDRECLMGNFFPEFFDIEDSETIRVIFRNVDVADRLRLVSSMHIFMVFYNCIFRGRDHMVEMCIREATLSKEDWNRLMDAFVQFLTIRSKIIPGKNIPNHRLIKNRFCRLIYKIGESTQGKICLEDETLNKAK